MEERKEDTLGKESREWEGDLSYWKGDGLWCRREGVHLGYRRGSAFRVQERECI